MTIWIPFPIMSRYSLYKVGWPMTIGIPFPTCICTPSQAVHLSPNIILKINLKTRICQYLFSLHLICHLCTNKINLKFRIKQSFYSFHLDNWKSMTKISLANYVNWQAAKIMTTSDNWTSMIKILVANYLCQLL